MRSSGVDAKLRRIEFIVGGQRVPVPILSGNSIRGLLRRAAATTLLELMEVPRESLPVATFDLLFAGGALEKGSGNDARVGEIRDLKRHVPVIGLFGGSAVNTIIAGMLEVDMAVPVVAEMEPWTGVASEVSVWDIVQEIPYTRRDDRDDREETSRTQMRYTVEAISPGTLMQHGARLRTSDPILVGCFWDAVERVARERGMGGKSAVGHGRFSWTWTAPDGAVDAYRDHVREHRDEAWAALGLDRVS